jgi:hypothetical protein
VLKLGPEIDSGKARVCRLAGVAGGLFPGGQGFLQLLASRLQPQIDE